MAASDITPKGRKRKIEEGWKVVGYREKDGRKWKEKQDSLIIVAHTNNI